MPDPTSKPPTPGRSLCLIWALVAGIGAHMATDHFREPPAPAAAPIVPPAPAEPDPPASAPAPVGVDGAAPTLWWRQSRDGQWYRHPDKAYLADWVAKRDATTAR